MKKILILMFFQFFSLCVITADVKMEVLECNSWEEVVPFKHYTLGTVQELYSSGKHGDGTFLMFNNYQAFVYPIKQDNFKVPKASEDYVRGFLVFSHETPQRTIEEVDAICVDFNLKQIDDTFYGDIENCCFITADQYGKKKIIWGYHVKNTVYSTDFCNIIELGDIEPRDFVVKDNYLYLVDDKTNRFYYAKNYMCRALEVESSLSDDESLEKGIFLKVDNHLGTRYYRMPQRYSKEYGFYPVDYWDDSQFGPGESLYYCVVDENGNPDENRKLYIFDF